MGLQRVWHELANSKAGKLRSWHLVPSLYGKQMGKQWKQWQTIFMGLQKSLQMVTVAMKWKKHLLLGRKVMTNLDSILKSRDITLPRKVCLVKAMVFPVGMYGCESWTVKKAECWEPAREIPPMTRSCGEAWWARWVRSRGVLRLSISPEIKTCLFPVCYTILFWHNRGLSPKELIQSSS